MEPLPTYSSEPLSGLIMRKEPLKAKLRPYTEKSDREQVKKRKGKTSLYRHFDKDGQLLYVGISLSHVARLAQHRDSSHWYEEITHVTIEWYETRVEAELAETRAIGSEFPKHNKSKVQSEKSLEHLRCMEKEELLDNMPVDPNILHKFWRFSEQLNEWHKRMGIMEEEFERVTDVWDDTVQVVKDVERKYSWLDDRKSLVEVKERQNEFKRLRERVATIEHIFNKLKETKSGTTALERVVRSTSLIGDIESQIEFEKENTFSKINP